MEKNDLIERYIYAVTKHMKSAVKKDVAAELSSIIQDMLDERCGDVLPTEHDVKVVLTELGTPFELSQKYDTDEQKCLIGPPYYQTYRYVLKIVLICVAGGMLLAQIMAAVTSNEIWYVAVANTVAGIAGGLLTAFAFVTLLFAVFYKKGIKMDILSDSIDNLPAVPEKKNKISKADAIIGIAFSIIFMIIFIVCPQIVCMVWIKDGVGIYQPIFNVDYIRQSWYFILLFGIMGITRDSVKLLDGCYTKRLMIVTVVTNLVSAVFSVVWLLNEKIIDPSFRESLTAIFQLKEEAVPRVLYEFPKIFLAVIIFALALNTIETVVRTVLNRAS